jgi:HEAT repeat protein
MTTEPATDGLTDFDLIDRLNEAERQTAPDERAWWLTLNTRLKAAGLDRVLAAIERAAASAGGRNSEGYWVGVGAARMHSTQATFDACGLWSTAMSPTHRAAAADILAQLGPNGTRPFRDVSLPIVTALLNDQDAAVVEAAAFAIGHLRDAPLASDLIARLQTLEAHPDADVRLGVVHAYTSSTCDDGTPGLIRLSRDADTAVRDWATFGLGSMSSFDSQDLRAALVARLTDEDDNTRGEALVGLAVRKDSRALATIGAELARKIVSGFAIEAAAALPDHRFISNLETLLARHPDDTDIQAALEACRTGVPVVRS